MNKGEKTVIFVFFGIIIEGQTWIFYRNIQINGTVFLWINIHFCLYITEYVHYLIKHLTSMHLSRSQDKKTPDFLQYRFSSQY